MFSIVTVIDDTGDPSQDLTTVEAVLSALDIDGDVDTNAEIQDQITHFSKIIATACDRDFSKEYISEQFILDRHMCVSKLPLSRYPVETIFSVSVNGNEIDPSNYQIDPQTGLLHSFCGWHGNTVVVIYTGGYDLPEDSPDALSQACVECIRDRRTGAGSRDTSLRAMEDAGTRVEYFVGVTQGSMSLPSNVYGLIAPFRKWRA